MNCFGADDDVDVDALLNSEMDPQAHVFVPSYAEPQGGGGGAADGWGFPRIPDLPRLPDNPQSRWQDVFDGPVFNGGGASSGGGAWGGGGGWGSSASLTGGGGSSLLDFNAMSGVMDLFGGGLF